MVKISISIYIDAYPEDVFKYISNFENNPKWQKGMVSASYTTTQRNEVGAKYDQMAKFMGKEVITSFKVIEYLPGKRIKATSESGSFPITFTRWVEPANKGTNLQALIEGSPKGFFKLTGPLMSFFVKRSIKKDYKNLKSMFETNQIQFEDQRKKQLVTD